MCGRFNIITDPKEWMDALDVVRSSDSPGRFEPRYNIGPSEPPRPVGSRRASPRRITRVPISHLVNRKPERSIASTKTATPTGPYARRRSQRWNGWQFPTGVPIPWAEISKAFLHQGERVHFASRALGIFKPRQMTAALSIKTVMPGAADLLSCRSRAAHLVRGDLAGVGRGLQGG